MRRSGHGGVAGCRRGVARLLELLRHPLGALGHRQHLRAALLPRANGLTAAAPASLSSHRTEAARREYSEYPCGHASMLYRPERAHRLGAAAARAAAGNSGAGGWAHGPTGSTHGYSG